MFEDLVELENLHIEEARRKTADPLPIRDDSGLIRWQNDDLKEIEDVMDLIVDIDSDEHPKQKLPLTSATLILLIRLMYTRFN